MQIKKAIPRSKLQERRRDYLRTRELMMRLLAEGRYAIWYDEMYSSTKKI